MKYKVYLDELEEESNKLINYSKNDINNKIEELRKIIYEINWQGNARDSYINEYNNKIEKINNMNSKIRMLGEYLKFSKEHYGETQEKLKKNWEEYLNELKKEDLNGLL